MAYKNKEDQAKASRRHYLANREKEITKAGIRSLKIKKENREFVNNYKRKNPCIDCGNPDIRVLDFDHITDNKTSNVSTMVSNGYSLKTIQKEIDKCEIVCANCHRIRTYERYHNKIQV